MNNDNQNNTKKPEISRNAPIRKPAPPKRAPASPVLPNAGKPRPKPAPRNAINEKSIQKKPSQINVTTRMAAKVPAKRREPAAKVMKRFFAKLGRYTAIFLILYITMALIYCGGVYLSLTSTSSDSVNKLDAVVEITPATSDTRAVNLTYDADDIYFDGVMYLPIDFLGNFTDIAEIGDFESRTFLLGNNETIRCYIDRANAEINGSQSFLKDPVVFFGGKTYLSINFYRTMMTGLKIDNNDENDLVKISLDKDSPLGFNIHACVTSDAVENTEN